MLDRRNGRTEGMGAEGIAYVQCQDGEAVRRLVCDGYRIELAPALTLFLDPGSFVWNGRQSSLTSLMTTTPAINSS